MEEQRPAHAVDQIVDIGVFVLGIGFVLCLVRLVKGPTLADRGIASDLLAMQVVGLMAGMDPRLIIAKGVSKAATALLLTISVITAARR